MEKMMTRTIKSGGRSYEVKVTFTGITLEQLKGDAMNYYMWKLQNTLRNSKESEQVRMSRDGITVHYSEVGKKVQSAEQVVEKMSDEQALVALEILKARLGKN